MTLKFGIQLGYEVEFIPETKMQSWNNCREIIFYLR